MIYYNDGNMKTNLNFIKSITHFEFSKKINEHGYLNIEAIVKQENKDEYINDLSGVEFELNDEVLFRGIVLNIDFNMEGGLWKVKLKCVTYTYLLDIKKERESFQDKNLTYDELIGRVLKKYTNSRFISTISKEKTIENFTMQYDETDWNFLKRMASRFNKCLYADNEIPKSAFYFGNPIGKSIGKLNEFNFSVSKNMEYFLNASKGQYSELTELDVTEFNIETDKNYELGDNVIFKEVKLYIKEKRFAFIRGILKFKYILTTLKNLGCQTTFNQNIVGLSLKGEVLEVINDKVKVKLEIDEQQDKSIAWKFPYTTVYTAEGSSGWYCMPEIGDTVLIYFPNNREEFGVGKDCLRVKYKETDKISDPSTKYFRTSYGKEIKISPNEICITCISNKHDKTYIKLSDEGGIELISTKMISFKSEKSINLEAEEVIKLLAKEQILLKCKKNQIKIDDGIDIAGEDVRIN